MVHGCECWSFNDQRSVKVTEYGSAGWHTVNDHRRFLINNWWTSNVYKRLHINNLRLIVVWISCANVSA